MQIYPGIIVYDEEGNEFVVENQLGNGGFGTVYKIKRKSDDSIFALKVITTSFPDKKTYDSFVNEAILANKLSGENVIKHLYFHDGEKYKLPAYILMEFANQGSLKELIEAKQKEESAFSDEELKDLFKQLITGMKIVNFELVHRDIKPENILIHKNVLKITDFGLSKIAEETTRTNSFKGGGTPLYMSPEAFELKENTTSMDMYSMGAIFYELTTLKFMFNDKKFNSYDELKQLHLYEVPTAPNNISKSISPIIAKLILRMLEKNPADRFNNWDEVEQYLDEGLSEDEEDDGATDFIQTLLTRDSEEEQKRLAIKAREEKKATKNKLVIREYVRHIAEPITKFIDKINTKYPGDKQIGFFSNDLTTTITLSNRNNLKLDVRTVFEEDCKKIVNQRGITGRTIRKEVIVMPLLRGKEILAWGSIKASNSKGYNLVLVKDTEHEYGQWFTLTNTNSALVARGRRNPEPFAHDLRDLGEELKNINSTHVFDMKDELFDLRKLTSLLQELI